MLPNGEQLSLALGDACISRYSCSVNGYERYNESHKPPASAGIRVVLNIFFLLFLAKQACISRYSCNVKKKTVR